MQRWPFPVYVGYVPNEAAWDYEMRRLKREEPYPDNVGGRCTTLTHNKTGDCVCLITFNGIETDAQLIEIAVHECVHAWQNTLETIGEDKPSAEFEAYMLGDLVRGLVEAYRSFHDQSD